MHSARLFIVAAGLGLTSAAVLHRERNTPTCGVRGYDKINPPAALFDGSSTYSSFGKCKQYCAGYGSFAFSTTDCLCYDCKVNDDNFRGDDGSQYSFFDIDCPSPNGGYTTTTATKAAATTTAKPVTTTTPAALTQCPHPLGYLVARDYTLYSNCLDTDLQIPSPHIYYGLSSNRDCSDKCQAVAGCTKGVFNLGTKTCYLKGSPSVGNSNWQPNTGFDVIEKVPNGTPLTTCLSAYSIKNNGKTWTVCPGTNFHNNPARAIWYNVATEYECASKCDSFAGCQKFTYSFATRTCYEKGNPKLADTLWTVSSGINSYFLQ